MALQDDRTAKMRRDVGVELGLALSGGGFRAALFHIGVLARLAELDLLRHVEAISTVSGGSIVGVLYYLHVKRLLETKPDGEIRREDYVDIVAQLERDFLEAVQRNIRTLALASPVANLRMAFGGYSWTERLAELYESRFYAPMHGAPNPLPMKDLLVRPDGAKFSPAEHNASRVRAKVPMLFVNATTLNTGRGWVFTQTWMGERYGKAVDHDPSVNAILRGLYYDQALGTYRTVAAATAVAASACVPGLFPPLRLAGLFEGWSVLLVDGGVHDNQGLGALEEYGCRHVVVSDGSGLMEDAREPSPLRPGVAARSNSVLQARVRELTLRPVTGPAGHVVVHLKDGIPPEEVTALNLPPVDHPGASVTPNGVNPGVQQALARVRTDLDAFSDVEADALMADGYLIASRRLAGASLAAASLAPPVPGPEHGWRFRWMIPHLGRPESEPRLLPHLRAGQRRLFKAWSTVRPLRALTIGAGLATALLLCGFVWEHWNDAWDRTFRIHLSWRAVAAAVAAALGLVAATGLSIRARIRAARITIGVAASVLGWIVLGLYLLLLNPLFLAAGRRPRSAQQPSWVRAPRAPGPASP